MTLSRIALLAAGAVLALAPAAARAHDGHGRGGHHHGWHDRHQHHRGGWHDRGHHDRGRWQDRDGGHHRHGWRGRDDHRHHGWHGGGGYRPHPGPAYGYRVVPPPVWLPPPPRVYAPLPPPGFYAPPPAAYGYLPSAGYDHDQPPHDEADHDTYAEAAPHAAEGEGPRADPHTVAIGGLPKR